MYTGKLEVLLVEEKTASMTCQELKEQSEFVSTQIQGLRARRERVVSENVENLHFSHEEIARKWILMSKGETSKQKQELRTDWLKDWLKREKAERLRNIMLVGLEEMLKKTLKLMLSRITSACQTENIEEIVRKHEDLLAQNEALVVDSESVLQEISVLKVTYVHLQEELKASKQGREGYKKDQDSFPLIDLVPQIQEMKRNERRLVHAEARITQIDTMAKNAINFLIRVLNLFVNVDSTRELHSPDHPPLLFLTFPQLSLLFIKTITTAHTISQQRPAYIVKKKNVVLAVQMMLHNTMSRHKTIFSSQKPSEHYNSHFVKPVLADSESVRRDSYIGSLLSTVANYEKIAWEGVRSLPNLQGLKDTNITDQEKAEVEEIRQVRKRYQIEKRATEVVTAQTPLSPRPGKCVSPRFGLPKIDPKQILAKEMIELDRQRREISLQNLRHWKEGTLSLFLLSSRIRSSKFPVRGRKFTKTDTDVTARTPRSTKSGATETERSTKYTSPKSSGKQSLSLVGRSLRSRQDTQRLKRLFEDTV